MWPLESWLGLGFNDLDWHLLLSKALNAVVIGNTALFVFVYKFHGLVRHHSSFNIFNLHILDVLAFIDR